MEQDNEPIPEPTPITAIKYKQNEVPAVIDVFMPAFRDKINNRFKENIITADLADKDGVNCSKIFQNALTDYLGIQQ